MGLVIENGGSTTVTSGPVTIQNLNYPRGWDAVVLGIEIGAGLTIGAFATACILIAISKLIAAVQ